MATVYKIEMEVVSDFCSYTEEQMKQIVSKLINGYVNPKTKLGLYIHQMQLSKIK
jgi:hypothetical protein